MRNKHSNSLPNTFDRSNRSESIPISTEMRRSASDAKFDECEAEADHQDYLFFTRVVAGISRKQAHFQDGNIKGENELTLNNIMRTRHEDAYIHNYKFQESSSRLAFHSDAYAADFAASRCDHFPDSDPAEQAFDSEIFEMEM
jgi:hypothetical protein